ncbi:hypothetical protein LINPERPRIM_LOCUS33053 [Linum perenne]
MDFSSGDDVEQQPRSVENDQVPQPIPTNTTQSFPTEPYHQFQHGIGLERQQLVDSGSEADSESSCYSSDRSAHVRNLVSDEEGPEDIYDDAPVYNPSCDHKHLQFQLGMKFKSPTQFKHAVVKHAIYAGSNLIWTRSGKKRCEAICRESTCKWRIYGSWYRVSKCFMVRSIGSLHSCPRSQIINQATASWIAYDFLERFRINREWDVHQIVAEVRLRYGIEVSARHCYRAKKKSRRHAEWELEG